MGEGRSFPPGGSTGHASSTQRVERREVSGTALWSHRRSPAGPVPGRRRASPAGEVSLLPAWDARRKTAFLFLPEGKMGPLVTHPARHLFLESRGRRMVRSNYRQSNNLLKDSENALATSGAFKQEGTIMAPE